MDRSLKWSQGEKRAARRAFDLAYQRECAALMKQVQKMARDLEEPDDLWKLHSFLSTRRRDIDDTYDFRASVLATVLAGLIADRWITLDDLDGLGDEKREAIRGIVKTLSGDHGDRR